MDYNKYIGEEITRYDGVKGVISGVEDGCICNLEFEGNVFGSGGYLYDPFIKGEVEFVKPELQQQINEKLSEIDNNYQKYINDNIAENEEETTFFLTKRNDDGIAEIEYRLKCEINTAKKIFGYVVHKQGLECRDSKTKWRQLRLIDSSNGLIVAQES